MDALTLNKWTRFAEKGGIGKARGLVGSLFCLVVAELLSLATLGHDRRHDVLATVKGDLMFMKDEVIVVLKVLVEDQSYLVSFQVVTLFDRLSSAKSTSLCTRQGACEGVIGRFNHSDVDFLQKQLKRPVFVPHNKRVKHSEDGKTDPGPMVIVVPPQQHVPASNPNQQAEPSRERTTTVESTQTVCLPSIMQPLGRPYATGTETPTTADTFQTASSVTPPFEAFSPIFHAHPQHPRHTPHPILVPSALQAGSHVSLTASQPGTASSIGGGTDFSSLSSPVRSDSQLGDTSYTSMNSGWEASSSRSSMDVYVETLRNDRDSGSDVETPTVKTVEADLAKPVHSTTDALSPAKSAEVEVEKALGSSMSASSASTNASFDFKAHRSFRASNPFALDTGLGGWSGSERGSSPAGTSIDERNDDDDDSMLGPSSSGSSQARSIPPRFVLAHDEEDEDDHRRAEWESRLELDEPELTIGSSGTPSVSFSASNSMSSINSYLSGSGESIRDVTITSKPSKEAQGTFGRSTSTGLASQLRAKLVVAPPHSLQAKKGWDTPSPIPSPTPSDAPAPARPPMRRIDSERKAAKIKQEMAKEVKASQSQPVPLRPAAQASKYASVPLDKDQENSKTCLLPASQPASTNHTLSDIYSNYRGKLGSSRSEQDHEPDHKDEQVNTKKLMARRSQSLSYSHSQGSAFSAEGNNFPSFATSSFADSTGSLPTSRSRILEQGYRSGGVQAQDSSLGTDPSSTSGSLLSCLSSNSESEPVLMTPHLSGRAYAAHCTSDIAPQIQTSSDDLAASQVLYARKDEATQTVRVEPKQEETSIGATAIARRRRAFTLRGEMSADLSKASNPVPIRFYIGDAGEPSPSPRHDRAVTSPEVRSATDRESLPSVPSTPFFPKTSKDAPGTSFTRMEVPLPLHNSPSTQSMMQAYDGVDVEIPNNEEQFSNGRETISPMLQIRNSVRKRSLSLKRSQPQLRVDTNVAPPPVPLARVKSERCASPSAGRGSLPLPIPTNHGGQSARSKLSVAGSLPEASPISSKDYFKTERYNDTQFTMNNETDNRNWQQVQAEETDEWGFIGNSPVPAIYATQRADPKLTAKVEQNIVSGLVGNWLRA